MAERLTFALPKGRILDAAAPLLRRAGLDISPLRAKGERRLRFDIRGEPVDEGPRVDFRVLLVKPSDVPTYVEHGVADLGIAGRDTLEEGRRDLYEPVDLRIGRCRMCVAEPADRQASRDRGAVLRVATKYPNCAARHFRARGQQAEIIKLSGSVELGPITGLADQIVDIVESGATLVANNLVEVETIMEVSSRLVVHPASLRVKEASVASTIERMQTAVAQATRVRKAAS